MKCINPRIEKKLSKRLVQVAPFLFKRHIINDEPTELAFDKDSAIRHCPYLEGSYCSYLGDAEDGASVYMHLYGLCIWGFGKVIGAGVDDEGNEKMEFIPPKPKDLRAANLIKYAISENEKLKTKE